MLMNILCWSKNDFLFLPSQSIDKIDRLKIPAASISIILWFNLHSDDGNMSRPIYPRCFVWSFSHWRLEPHCAERNATKNTHHEFIACSRLFLCVSNIFGVIALLNNKASNSSRPPLLCYYQGGFLAVVAVLFCREKRLEIAKKDWQQRVSRTHSRGVDPVTVIKDEIDDRRVKTQRDNSRPLLTDITGLIANAGCFLIYFVCYEFFGGGFFVV